MKNENLEFVVEKSNIENFKRNIQIILGLIENKQDIPYEPVREMLSFLQQKEKFQYKFFAQKAKKASKYAIDFISTHVHLQTNVDFRL
jgi:hypothetical protein